MAEQTVTQSNSGETIALRVGDSLTVQLDENRTSGFQWRLDEQGGDALALEQSEYTAPTQSGLGAAGAHAWRFVAKKEGAGRIVLQLARPWERGKSASGSFVLNVQVRA